MVIKIGFDIDVRRETGKVKVDIDTIEYDSYPEVAAIISELEKMKLHITQKALEISSKYTKYN